MYNLIRIMTELSFKWLSQKRALYSAMVIYFYCGVDKIVDEFASKNIKLLFNTNVIIFSFYDVNSKNEYLLFP